MQLVHSQTHSDFQTLNCYSMPIVLFTYILKSHHLSTQAAAFLTLHRFRTNFFCVRFCSVSINWLFCAYHKLSNSQQCLMKCETRATYRFFFVIRSHFVCAVNIEYHLPSSDCCYRFVLKRFSVCQCAVVRFVVIDARVFFRCVRIFTHRNYEQWQKTKLWWKTVDDMMTTFISFCLVRCVCVRRHLWRKLFRLDTCTVIVVSCFWCWWVDRFWITTHR